MGREEDKAVVRVIDRVVGEGVALVAVRGGKRRDRMGDDISAVMRMVLRWREGIVYFTE